MYQKKEIAELIETETSLKYKTPYKNNLDHNEYYTNLDPDDYESDYFEWIIGTLHDTADPDNYEIEEDIDDDDIDGEEEFLSYIDISIKQNIQNAKQLRKEKKFQEAINLCRTIWKSITLQKIYSEKNIYLINLTIAILGDSFSEKAYFIATETMQKITFNTFENLHSFKNTLFGLLAKPVNFPEYFLEVLYEKYPEVLKEYYDQLSEKNPKKKFLEDFLKK